MRRIGSQLLGIDRGEVTMFEDYRDGGPMWAGQGARAVRQRVSFSARFHEQPVVSLGIAMLDTHCAANLRVDVRAENVGLAGFDAVLSTWGDSRIAQARLHWTALGALKHEEDWQL